MPRQMTYTWQVTDIQQMLLLIFSVRGLILSFTEQLLWMTPKVYVLSIAAQLIFTKQLKTIINICCFTQFMWVRNPRAALY